MIRKVTRFEHCYKPLAVWPDAEDIQLHQENCSSHLITQRLRELVPLFDFMQARVVEVSPEETRLTVSLDPATVNQNGTHQAGVFYVLADYAVGVSMFSAIPGVYVTGIHDRCHALPVQMWLKSGQIQHLAPGSGEVEATVRITHEEAVSLRRQLLHKGRCEYRGTVHIHQDNKLVAVAEHVVGMYVNKPQTMDLKGGLIQEQNRATSALMIAGLRKDRVSRCIAGEQGKALAARMTETMPQLPSMVQSRTETLEQQLREHGQDISQVVVLGVGLDPKPVYHSDSDQTWFGIDLKPALRDREKRFCVPGCTADNFIPVAGDMRDHQWVEDLAAAGFDPQQPTMVIMEGLSMYLTSNVIAQVFKHIESITSAGSVFWIDHITSNALHLEDARDFFSAMGRLGEPMVFGCTNMGQFVGNGWQVLQSVSAANVLSNEDRLFDAYRFTTLKRNHAATSESS
ncbi:MAG: DUF4442 domain-containing protein [Planctomycetaceae bacterium]|nr:DUF4442 domain-containing protein [Planctomycetaceae bacterium]